MEFIDGNNLFNSLLNGLSPLRFWNEFNILLEKLYSYDLEEINEKRSLDLFYSMMVNRAIGRTQSLLNYDDKNYTQMIDLIKLNQLRINGCCYMNPLLILNKISENEQMCDILRPRVTSMCTHGDLTLMNMVWSDTIDHNIKLIDPRGMIGTIDPLYDLGKIKFSLSGFSQIVYGNYILTSPHSEFELEIIGDHQAIKGIKLINQEFLTTLNKIPALSHLKKLEPNWQERILFYESLHYLADIPFRIYTDGNPRNAFACYLLGTIYLNELFEKIN